VSNKTYALYFAWLLSCIALLGSLYFSEIRNLAPCNLCWYQRIAIYPLTIILGIATYRNFLGIVPYVLPLALIGLIISIYHVAIQEVPSWQPIELCGVGPSCLDKIDIGLGPISIPMLSVLSQLLVCFFLFYSGTPQKKTGAIKSDGWKPGARSQEPEV
jgi:hypothetical protein